MRTIRSIVAWSAMPSESSLSASIPNGRAQRLARKPGPSRATITRLPIRSPAARAVSSASGEDSDRRRPPRAAPSAATGLKKCMPTTVLGPRGGASRARSPAARRCWWRARRPAPQTSRQLARTARASARGPRAPPRSRARTGRGPRARGAGCSRASACSASLARSSGRARRPSRGRARTAAEPALERLRERVVQVGLEAGQAGDLRDARRPSCPRRRRRASRGRRRRLTGPRNLGPALLEERLHALDAVLGRHRQLVEPALVREARGERHLLGGQHRLLGELHRERRAPRDHLARARRLARASLRFGRDHVHEARAAAPPWRRSGGRSGPAPSCAACRSRAPAAGCRRRPG